MIYRKLDLEQGTPRWLEWRLEDLAISSTDAGTIMGLNPFEDGDIYSLWATKIGLKERRKFPTEIMQHGTDTEEEARQSFVNATDVEVYPVCLELIQYPWIKSSLDGINMERGVGVEIKCPYYFASFNKHKKEVPDYYYAQIQHHMLVSGLDRFHFWSYYQGNEVHCPIKRNDEFQNELLKRYFIFRALLKNKIEPSAEVFNTYLYQNEKQL